MVLVHSSDVKIWLSVFTFPKKKWEVMKNHIFKKGAFFSQPLGPHLSGCSKTENSD